MSFGALSGAVLSLLDLGCSSRSSNISLLLFLIRTVNESGLLFFRDENNSPCPGISIAGAWRMSNKMLGKTIGPIRSRGTKT